MKIIPEMHRSH